MQERYLTVDEVANFLSINKHTVYKLVKRKQLPSYKVGRVRRFLISEIKSVLEQKREQL